MPLCLTDSSYGHLAVFYAQGANRASATDVRWGPSSIEVPSNSPMNGVADVWLHIPSISLRRAASWCRRTHVSFLGPWRGHESQVLGFGFRVPHFSRFRFDESDDDEGSEDDLTEDTGVTSLDDKEGSALRRSRLQRAGSTPARPHVPITRTSLPVNARDPTSFRQLPADVSRISISAQRPRMSTRAITELDDTDPDMADDSESAQPGDELVSRPPVGDSLVSASDDVVHEGHPIITNQEGLYPDRKHRRLTFDDPDSFRPVQQWSTALGGDASNLHRLREALFPPSQVDLVDREPFAQDTDMADLTVTSADEDFSEGLTYDVHGDEFGPIDHDAEDNAVREADDFVSSDVPRHLVAEIFTSSVLPFPAARNSVTANKYGVFTDMGLTLGRSMRASFAPSTNLVFSFFRMTRGFMTAVHDSHSTVIQLPRSDFTNILRHHCSIWYESICNLDQSKYHDAVDPEADSRREVRMPTLKISFRNRCFGDGVMSDIVDLLRSRCGVTHDQNSEHASIAFEMLLALYRSDDGDTSADGQPGLLRRLSDWAQGPAGKSFDKKEDNVQGLRKAVIALALGKVEEAVDITIDLGHLRLAMLMARALETPKDKLREDAEAQLGMYGLQVDDEEDSIADEFIDARYEEKWDRILLYCEEEALVSVDERMILLILAGHVSSVARFLKFSWYRLFIMELLHGAGSFFGEQWERVSAAVQAVTSSTIHTFAPHKETNNADIVYQLLRLYAEDGDKHKLTRGLFSNSSFGTVHQAMDYRFNWLLHQVVVALLPEASPKDANIRLSDGFAAQLQGSGLPLWAFYVLCSGGASGDVLKETLIRNWSAMQKDIAELRFKDGELQLKSDEATCEDNVDGDAYEEDVYTNAEEFLIGILGIPSGWVHEAKAIAARAEGTRMEECEQWLLCNNEHGAARCHQILIMDIIPGAIIANDKACLIRVFEILVELENMKGVPNWSCGGGLILGYLKYVSGTPILHDAGFDVLHEMVRYVRMFVDRANSNAERCAGAIMADGIMTAQRAYLMRITAVDREKVFLDTLADLDEAPCSRAVRLRLTAEYTLATKHGWPDAQRIAAAFPGYTKFLRIKKKS